ncbi:MAG: glutamate--tRNA ligase family protein [Sulfurovum sp.]|nr:glutamate--tRNA ligase family protein [Sulfurovum sp.]
MLRFAISPTRDMHIGNLRVAILNFLVAQQRNVGFIIRMDDTEKAKNIEGKDTEIMQILEKFALNHESVFHQSEHFHMHQTLAIKLLEQDKAFVCTCMDNTSHDAPYSGKCYDVDKSEHAKLKSSGTPFVIRIKQPTENVVFDDLIQGTIRTTPSEVDSFVILKEDGTPTQTFASACDDMLSGITTLICESDHLLDTAREIHTKSLLGFDAQIEYAHIPVMPKVNDDTSLKGLFSQGFIPDAIINYLLLLGNTDVPSEVFTLPEAIEWFDIKDISKTSLDFDSEKLRFINRQHLLQMEDKALSTLFGFADADIGKLAKLYLEEVSTGKELDLKIKAIFSPKDFSGHWGEQMRTLENVIQNAPMFSKFNDFISYIMLKSELKDGNLFIPLRLLLTGAEHGPELSDIYPLIKSYLLEIAS